MKNYLFTIFLLASVTSSFAENLTLKVSKRFMNVPIYSEDSPEAPRRNFKMIIEGDTIGVFTVPFAEPNNVSFYSAIDMSLYRGKELTLHLEGEGKDLERVIFSNKIIEEQKSYSENNRPQLHFSPRRGWLNDPNGFIYTDGVYHIYYQHNPFNIYWGNMSWGHATSRDLVHWEEQPVVLFPREKEGDCFSGAAFIDERNQLGLQRDNEDVVVAFYLRTKLGLSYAYSNDNGRSFVDYEGNPIIATPETRIDTPRPVWHKESQRWVCTTFDVFRNNKNELQRCVGIYSSVDLKEWRLESRVEHIEEHELGNELCGCVDFFEIGLNNNKVDTKWVMIFINGSYIIGDFDGKTLYNPNGEAASTKDRISSLIPFTRNFYATMSWYNLPDNRRVQMTWFSNPKTAISNKYSSVFSQNLTLPSELTMHKDGGTYYLEMSPVEELKVLRRNKHKLENPTQAQIDKLLAKQHGDTYEFRINIKPSNTGELIFNLRGKELVYNAQNNTLSFDSQLLTQITPRNNELSLQIFLDRVSTEIYVNKGQIYIPLISNSMALNPKEYSLKTSKEITINQFDIYKLKSIW